MLCQLAAARLQPHRKRALKARLKAVNPMDSNEWRFQRWDL
jgi:hypothetical protein